MEENFPAGILTGAILFLFLYVNVSYQLAVRASTTVWLRRIHRLFQTISGAAILAGLLVVLGIAPGTRDVGMALIVGFILLVDVVEVFHRAQRGSTRARRIQRGHHATF